MTRAVALLCTLLAGGVVALQPPANATLAQHVGDLGAAFFSAVLTCAVLGLLLLLAGHPGRLAALGSFRPVYALGGFAGAAIVAVSLVAVRPLGAGALTALIVAAQLAVSLIADRLGWFGLHPVGIGPARIAGLALVIAGTVLLTRS